MRGVTWRVVSSIIVSSVVMYLLLLATGVNGIPEDLLEEFRQSWFWGTVNSGFVRLLPVSFLTGLVLAWSAFIDKNIVKRALGPGKQFGRMVQSSIVLVLVFLVIYVLGLGIFESSSLRQASKAVSDTYLARYYQAETEAAFAQGDYKRANEANRKTVIIAPRWTKARETHERIVVAVKDLYSFTPAPGSSVDQLSPGVTWDDLMTEVQIHADKGDLFTALFFAETARGLGNQEQKIKSGLVMDEIRNRIGGVDPVPRRAEPSVYELKQLAILGQYGTGDFIGAYYTLKTLEKKEPTDKELLHWMPRVVAAVEGMAFFREELEESLAHASIGSLLARFSLEDNRTLVIGAHRVLKGRFQNYLTGAVIVELDSQGRVVYQAMVDEAKLVPGIDKGTSMVMTRSLLKDAPESVKEAYLEVGSRERAERNLYTIPTDAETLWDLANLDGSYGTIGIFDLLKVREKLVFAGWDTRSFDIHLITRFTIAFSLAGLWFAAMAFGWANRSRHAVKPLPLVILILAALPLLSLLMLEVYGWLVGIILQSLVPLLGFWGGVGVGAGIVTALVLWSLVYLSSQKVDG